MKLLFDLLPVILFFTTFQAAKLDKDWAASFATQHFGFAVAGGVVGAEEAPVLLATLVVIAATCLQVAVLKARGRKIDLMLWISLALVVVLGAATVWFHDPKFIEWKPTIAFWIMAIVFWASQTFFGKNLLRATIGEDIQLPPVVWQRLYLAWVGFFAVMGALNLWVAYAFSLDAWANFHTFGTYALMAAFVIGQGLYLGKHLEEDDERADR